MKAILISRCLLGEPCRYDGASRPCPGVEKLRERFVLVPICPECDGGLPVPRTPAEICGDRVTTEDGRDVSAAYRRGAEAALEKAKETGATIALLKSRSPSCGIGLIYDGSFSKTLTPGDGMTAKLLKANGLTVFDETALDALLTRTFESTDERG